MKQFGLIVLVGTILAALFVAFAPNTLFWGERHEAHERAQRIVLKSGERIGQTFLLEENALAGVAVWVDTKQPLPTRKNLELEVEVAGENIGALFDVHDIPESGVIIFQFEKPFYASKGDAGKYLLGLSEQAQNITLLFQIDAAIYSDGSLIHPRSAKQGDLAFQLLYTRPAFGSRVLHIGYAMLLMLCGYVVWYALRKYHGEKIAIQKNDTWIAFGICASVAIFYSLLLLRSEYWIGPTDFTKDAAYLGAGAEALKSFSWPLWIHTICGGLPLMGGIEGNAMSLGTLFALFMDSQRALMLMNVLEAGIAAAGAYVLARLFLCTKKGSVVAASIYALSPLYFFKIAIGYSMIGGVFAFAPWVLYFFIASLQRAHAGMAVLSGLFIGLTVLRGEAHVVVVLAVLLIVWGVYDAIAKKRLRALVLLFACFCMAFFVSSVKILPYLEHVTREPIKLFPYVALLTQDNLLFETLFRVNASHETVPVLHGKFGEEWGVFGSYIGIVPALLALVGLLFAKRYRFGLGLLLVVSFVLTEGTLYEYALRFIPPLDALLRMPVRNMLLVVLCIAVLAARGIDVLAIFVKYKYIKQIFYIGILLFLILDLGYATSLVARHFMSRIDVSPEASLAIPVFAQYEVSGDIHKNANILLASGYLLPQVCADQNRTVDFIKTVQGDTPFASIPARISPNAITLTVPPDIRDVFVNERFDQMWVSREASILEHSDGSMHVIPYSKNATRVVIEQISPTKRAQQVIVFTVIVYIATLWICRKYLV